MSYVCIVNKALTILILYTMNKLIALHKLLNTMNIDTTNLTVEQCLELLRILRLTFDDITN